MGLGFGWFSPQGWLGPDVGSVVGKIHELVGPSNPAFPLAISPLELNRDHVLHYGVLRGHLPIHIDQPNAYQRSQAMWTFFLEVVNRPVMLAHPADQASAQNVLLERPARENRKQAFVAIELQDGTAVHFDPTKTFHGVSQYPTGDPIPELPGATFIQLPTPDGREISWAANEAKRLMLLDERIAEFIK